MCQNLFLSIKKEIDEWWKSVFDDKIMFLTDLIVQNYHKCIGLHQKIKDMKGKFEEQKHFRHYQNMVIEACKLHDEFIEIYNT